MSKKLLPPIHLLCSDDNQREAMCYVEILDGIATATNGYLIGRMNIAEYGNIEDAYLQRLSGKYIHRDVWELLHNADEIMVSDEDPNRIIYYKGGIEAQIVIKDSSSIKYPDYHELIKKVANAKYDKKSFVAFNPEWIILSKKLFGKDALIVRFYENEGMFLVFPGVEAKAFMGIMPMEILAPDAVVDFSLT